MTYINTKSVYIKSQEAFVNVCPKCECRYQIGVDGTVLGCHKCTGTVGNALDGTIIEDEEDLLTDMEKA